MPADTFAEPSAGVRDGMEAFAFGTTKTRHRTEPGRTERRSSALNLPGRFLRWAKFQGERPLHNPSQLTRLVVGGLPCAGQKSVVAAWSALRDELRLVPRLVIDRTEIWARLGDDDLVITDFDAKATPSHRVTWRHPGDSASGLSFLDRRNPAAVGADQASVSLGADAGDDQGGVPSQWVDWRLFPLIRRRET